VVIVTVNNRPLKQYIEDEEKKEVFNFVKDELISDNKLISKNIKSKDPFFGLYRPSKPSGVKIKSKEGYMSFYKYLFFLLKGSIKDGALISDLVNSYYTNYNYRVSAATMRSVISKLVSQGYVYKIYSKGAKFKTSPIRVHLKLEYVDLDLETIYSDYISKNPRVIDKSLVKIDKDVSEISKIDSNEVKVNKISEKEPKVLSELHKNDRELHVKLVIDLEINVKVNKSNI